MARSARRTRASSGSAVRTANGAAQDLPATRESLAEALGVTIDPALLERALTHRSYAYENGGAPHNERLEFLGDAVLGLVITDALFRDHPDLPEGQLAKLRSSVVNMRALAGVAAAIGEGGLGSYLRLGRGEDGTGGRDKASILADAMEAILGAVYVDAGLATATELIHRLFDPLLRESALLGAGLDWKTSLQELAATMGLSGPEYEISESGPDHQKSFTAVVRLGGEALGTGEGTSKKEAEQKAAGLAWSALQERADAGSASGTAASGVAGDGAPGIARNGGSGIAGVAASGIAGPAT